jgi:hypothetical protein
MVLEAKYASSFGVGFVGGTQLTLVARRYDMSGQYVVWPYAPVRIRYYDESTQSWAPYFTGTTDGNGYLRKFDLPHRMWLVEGSETPTVAPPRAIKVQS